MIEYVLKKTSLIAKEITISCRSDCKIFESMYPSAMVIEDKWKKKGALTGILSSLPFMKSSYVAVVTCDCPRISPSIINELFHHAKGHDAAVPRWPNGYVEPLQAVYRRKRTLKAARETWNEEKMKMTEVLKKLPDLVYVSTKELRRVDPKLESFLNVN